MSVLNRQQYSNHHTGPTSGVANDSKYQVILSASIADLDGKPVNSDYSWHFNVRDGFPLTLLPNSSWRGGNK